MYSVGFCLFLKHHTRYAPSETIQYVVATVRRQERLKNTNGAVLDIVIVYFSMVLVFSNNLLYIIGINQ